MRLKPLLTLGVILTVALVSVRAVNLWWDARQMQALEAEAARLESLAADAASLLVLTQDFALFGTPRAVRQWEAAHAQLLEGLTALATVDPTRSLLAEELQVAAAGLRPMFAALKESVSLSPDNADDPDAEGADRRRRQDSLVDQLLNETRRVSDGAFELARALAARRIALAARARGGELLTLMVLASLVTALAVLVARRVLRPLQRLQAVAEAVGQGNLVPRTGYRADDEMGALASAVDDTTAALAAREKDLRQARRAAEAASEAKSLFLANMSHEIRTPMHAVLGLAHLLQDTSLSPAQRELLGRMQGASRSLMDILDDVLDLSKIEAGELALERAPVAPGPLVADTAAPHEAQARARGLDWQVEIDPALPDTMIGDGTRLRQILNNLLSNAIKFTEQGHVRLTVRVTGGPSPSPTGPDDARAPPRGLELCVEDSGIGMTQDVRERLFRPFMQADESITRRFGGTGLGLSIVARLVDLMGGQIEVGSQPGQGSRFRVQLPLIPAPPGLVAPLPGSTQHLAGPAPGRPPALQALRVLLVDDSDDNLEVTGRILQREGAQVAQARHGAEALTRLLAAPQGFDVVLMDLQMPVLDGLAATRAMRQDPALRALPVIGLSAGALASDRHRALEAGMDEFITKPFEPAALVQLLRQFAPPTAATHAGTSVGAGRSIAGPDQPWPELPGLDLQAARRRLQGDFALWRRLMHNLLSQHQDRAGRDDTDPAAAARHMHRLAGAAGIVGADALREAAMAAEACLRDPAGAPTVRRAAQAKVEEAVLGLAEQLAQADILPVREAPAASTQGPAAGLPTWLLALEQHDLSALEHFEAMAAGLRHDLGEASYRALETAMRNLDFDEAARLWKEHVAGRA